MILTEAQRVSLRQKVLTELARRKNLEDEKELCRNDLYEFVRHAWSSIDSSTFQDSWAIEALCEHLEAITRGEIEENRLLANYPPRCGKTIVTSICWPVWTWLQKERSVTSGPGVRFLCASYGDRLSLDNANMMRQLIASPWFQARWGSEIELRGDENLKSAYANTKGGKRQSTSIGGTLIGLGGDIVIVDDPHNTQQVESDAERERAIHGWREISTTRLNDPQNSAIVVIMQRLHEEDVSGVILSNEASRFCHLMIPMKYDSGRHCSTEIGWTDPRTEDGELMWPERFDESAVDDMETELGPYMASGRLQQAPTPKGGGIIRPEWWNLWEHKSHPTYSFTLATLDTGLTEKTENDPSGMQVWGVFTDERAGNTRANLMLAYAWNAHLPLHMPELNEDELRALGIDPLNTPILEKMATLDKHKQLGLVGKVALTCWKYKVNRLLIENKANGITVSQELRRLFRRSGFVTELYDPTSDGDKVARLHSVVPMFTDGMVWRPDRQWAQSAEDQISSFPKAKHDEMVDCCFVAGTIIATKRGDVPIEFVRVGDEALTPDGWRRVTAAWSSGIKPVITRCGLTGTSEHPLFTVDKAWQPLGTISDASKCVRSGLCGFLKIALLKSSLMALSIPAWAEVADTISQRQQRTPDGSILKGFTSLYGRRQISGRFPLVTMFTTRTRAPLIASLTIWSAYRLAIIGARMDALGAILRECCRTWKPFAHLPQRGILRTKGWRGIGNMLREVLRKADTLASVLVGNAGNGSLLGAMPDFAAHCAERNLDIARNTGQSVRKNANVRNAAQDSSAKSVGVPSFVPSRAETRAVGGPTGFAEVFNLEVEGAHCYFANGVLVHNCSSALQFFRRRQIIRLGPEIAAADAEAKIGKRPVKPLYPMA